MLPDCLRRYVKSLGCDGSDVMWVMLDKMSDKLSNLNGFLSHFEPPLESPAPASEIIVRFAETNCKHSYSHCKELVGACLTSLSQHASVKQHAIDNTQFHSNRLSAPYHVTAPALPGPLAKGTSRGALTTRRSVRSGLSYTRRRLAMMSTTSLAGTRTCSSVSRSRRVTVPSFIVSPSTVMHQGVPISSMRR